jgi:hypothetical protein
MSQASSASCVASHSVGLHPDDDTPNPQFVTYRLCLMIQIGASRANRDPLQLATVRPATRFGGNSAELHAFFLCSRYPETYYKFEDPDSKAHMLCFSNQAKEVRFVKFSDADHIALSKDSRVRLDEFATAMGLQAAGPA